MTETNYAELYSFTLAELQETQAELHKIEMKLQDRDKTIATMRAFIKGKLYKKDNPYANYKDRADVVHKAMLKTLEDYCDLTSKRKTWPFCRYSVEMMRQNRIIPYHFLEALIQRKHSVRREAAELLMSEVLAWLEPCGQAELESLGILDYEHHNYYRIPV